MKLNMAAAPSTRTSVVANGCSSSHMALPSRRPKTREPHASADNGKRAKNNAANDQVLAESCKPGEHFSEHYRPLNAITASNRMMTTTARNPKVTSSFTRAAESALFQSSGSSPQDRSSGATMRSPPAQESPGQPETPPSTQTKKRPLAHRPLCVFVSMPRGLPRRVTFSRGGFCPAAGATRYPHRLIALIAHHRVNAPSGSDCDLDTRCPRLCGPQLSFHGNAAMTSL